jgi:hypothetical protein
MKTYTFIFAEYIAHYGSAEIEAQNDEDAIAQAKAYWRSIERGEKTWDLSTPDYDTGILPHIVEITDDESREVAADIALDNYRLVNTDETGDAA